jgi:hypothetical protein
VDAEPPSDPTSDALLVLVAELHKAGLFDSTNLASMIRRLELAGLPEMADRVRSVPLCNAIDDPDEIRAGIHLADGE